MWEPGHSSVELQLHSLWAGHFKYDTNITGIRKWNSFRKFGQEILCCHAGVIGEIRAATMGLEGPMCAWLGLQQRDGLSWTPRDGCEESMFHCSQPHRSSSGLNEPLIALPEGAELVGSSQLANAVQMGSGGGVAGASPLLGGEPGPFPSSAGSSGQSWGLTLAEFLSIPFAASVHPTDLLQVLLPHHPWHHAGDVPGQARHRGCSRSHFGTAQEQRWAEKLNWFLL